MLEKFFEKGDEKVNDHLMQYLIDFHKDEIIDILIHINGFYVIKKSMNIRNKEKDRDSTPKYELEGGGIKSPRKKK